jgi:hypothetical protein
MEGEDGRNSAFETCLQSSNLTGAGTAPPSTSVAAAATPAHGKTRPDAAKRGKAYSTAGSTRPILCRRKSLRPFVFRRFRPRPPEPKAAMLQIADHHSLR